jgi:hypothetical protein
LLNFSRVGFIERTTGANISVCVCILTFINMCAIERERVCVCVCVSVCVIAVGGHAQCETNNLTNNFVDRLGVYLFLILKFFFFFSCHYKCTH